MLTSERLADAFFKAIEDGDVEAVDRLYAPSLVVWHSNDGLEQGKAANLATLGGMVRAMKATYTVIDRAASETLLAQRHTLTLENRKTALSVDLNVAIFIRFQNDQIVRIDEYFEEDLPRKLSALR
jgi:ketosteroid isomerase-like protein